jgi:hypothetical protein
MERHEEKEALLKNSMRLSNIVEQVANARKGNPITRQLLRSGI